MPSHRSYYKHKFKSLYQIFTYPMNILLNERRSTFIIIWQLNFYLGYNLSLKYKTLIALTFVCGVSKWRMGFGVGATMVTQNVAHYFNNLFVKMVETNFF